jgi:hypothetical protein
MHMYGVDRRVQFLSCASAMKPVSLEGAIPPGPHRAPDAWRPSSEPAMFDLSAEAPDRNTPMPECADMDPAFWLATATVGLVGWLVWRWRKQREPAARDLEPMSPTWRSSKDRHRELPPR